ncbi:MAG: glycine cleavage T C-terminal barrel domain-containing protein, partial [Alphaproteobacteria bacterium]
TARDRGIDVITGSMIVATHGRLAVNEVSVAAIGSFGRARTLGCDLVAVSGGWNPTVHLFSQSGGRLRWDDGIAAFVPERSVQAERSVGAARGLFDLAAALADGHAAGLEAAEAVGHPARDVERPTAAPGAPYRITPFWRVEGTRRRQWIDRLIDVTVGDVELAVRENFVSVEHLKRYTTLGMATDQGKTSNVNGLAVLAAITSRPIAEVGTTTFRPPYVPVPFATLTGLRRGRLHAPVRRLPAHAAHVRAGATFDEYGGWLRPASYPAPGEGRAAAIQREAAHPRQAVGLFDGSSLGKIEVAGPDAAQFLDLMYYNAIGALTQGRVRYALLLNENGKVFDDGVVARLGPERFLLSPSSSHAAAVHAALEEWRQCEYPRLRVFIEDLTASWATLAVTGPRARGIIERLDTDIALDARSLPHMAVAEGHLCGVPARVARVSYTGEAGFEISVPAGHAESLWDHLLALGAPDGIAPIGLEALMILRMEKGYILIGVDTDGNTEPQDLGMAGPLRSRTVDFVGRRSLMRPDSRRADRLQLVGLAVEGDAALPAGAHVLGPGPKGERSIGHVSSGAFSPTIGHAIALAAIEGGRGRMGEAIAVFSRGARYRARIVSPTFYDPAGARLHG